MGGCQNYDPFLGTLNIRCCIIIGILEAIILTATHIERERESERERDIYIYIPYADRESGLKVLAAPGSDPAATSEAFLATEL